MPTWTHNRLELRGEPQEVERLVADLESLEPVKETGARSVLDFERQAPTPPELYIELLRSDGKSFRAVAVQLNAEGITTPTGARWHPTSVKRAVRDAYS